MEMKNRILSWLVTIGLCIVLIPIGCILLILNILWSTVNQIIRKIKE
mgnify:FL=1